MTAGNPKHQIDTSKPHPARVYDYLLGGKDHYLVDRELGEQLADFIRVGAEQNRAFMHRATAWAAHQGIDQYLDIGTGIPTEPNLHQIVQEIIPAARVVYADNDPIVLRHAEALLVSTPEGATHYIQADVREPQVILEHARTFLDFSRPVALSLIAIMHFILDEEDPHAIVRELVGQLPSGSCLILAQASLDSFPEAEEHVASTYSSHIPFRPRARAEIVRFFDGLDPVEPGVVTAPEWFKDTPAPELIPYPGYVGVGLVP
ncbi:SAM-dependent methyltransferase [Streptomyces sp. NBC_01020]|uniref:SAM-dependent methyltransferase n=1 Tax=Streptomyces sp. NBC_01020 TaxID=2903722 RepID=UPI00386E724D|nr:SAM-dependent methyltransferase [Streptomyces sp. NBC_01020]